LSSGRRCHLGDAVIWETSMPRSAGLIAALLVGLAAPALADPVADFYSGTQIKLVIRASVGGSYDSYSRLLGRH
jgi:tripartite-type tricarboxylate transporter receptor subunit TctC